MHRFFVIPSDISNDFIKIYDKDEIKHIKNVLRMEKDEIITICDGNSNDYTVKIEEIDKDSIKTSILEKTQSNTEPSVKITLFQSIPKGSKMDYIIEKTVEIGIYEIYPVITDRTIVKLDNPDSKINRWQKISESAAKQSKRGIIPKINNPISVVEAIKLLSKSDLGLMPYEKEDKTGIKDIENSKAINTIGFFIGPEGGFTEEEVKLAKDAGIKTLKLGPRIFRTETAGTVTLSILLNRYGDI